MLCADHAALMSAAFLGDVMGNLAEAASASPIVPYVAFAPSGAERAFDGIVDGGTHMLLADGAIEAPPGVEGFGRSLLHAIRALLRRGHGAACVLNADSPNLPTRLLLQAHAALAREGEHIVLGPAEDGGYYLLGMKAEHATLFSQISWSSDQVAEQTRARAACLGLPVIELESWYDVDEPATLKRLLSELRQPGRLGQYAAPRTLACAARIGLLPVGEPQDVTGLFANAVADARLAGAI
jgi:hypothetical protein